MKKFRLSPFFLFVALFLSTPSFASEGRKSVGFRSFFNIGTWMSYYQQKSPGHDVKVSTLLAPAVGMNIGMRINFIFLEYAWCWGISPYSSDPKDRDATYFAPFGGNVGLSLPYIPIEPYIGYESGRYGLSSGGEPVYNKSVVKFGGNFLLPFANKGRIGLRAEYRTMAMTEDNTGGLPANVSTSSQVYFIFLTIGFAP